MSVLKVVLLRCLEKQNHANPLIIKNEKRQKIEALSLKFSGVIDMFSTQF